MATLLRLSEKRGENRRENQVFQTSGRGQTGYDNRGLRNESRYCSRPVDPAMCELNPQSRWIITRPPLHVSIDVPGASRLGPCSDPAGEESARSGEE